MSASEKKAMARMKFEFGLLRGILREVRPHITALTGTDDHPRYKDLLRRIDDRLADGQSTEETK